MVKLSYGNIYTKVFSTDYLLRNGYFNFRVQKNKKAVKMGDYFKSSFVYKRILNLEQLANHMEEIKKKVRFTSHLATFPIELSIFKNGNERRNFKLPNPYAYISLCQHLVKHKEGYQEILNKSKKSISKNFHHHTFLENKQIKEENRFGKRKIFQTDIQNFFPSIYTHSIAWMLVGKDEAKANKKCKEKYYNELDTLIQHCQNDETHGLQTGSLVSHIIAEIYMSKVDEYLAGFSYISLDYS